MNEIKPIETYYKGYRFRSRLEARWAVFFDYMGIPYEYEPEGLILPDGTYYLPDFYLPDSNQFFEVKGFLNDLDMNKVQGLIELGYSVTVGYANGKFQACDNFGHYYELTDSTSSWLCWCKVCGRYYFIGCNGGYECPHCGSYDGDHLFNIVMEGNPDNNYSHNSLWDVARQARFEHGETPIIKQGGIIR